MEIFENIFSATLGPKCRKSVEIPGFRTTIEGIKFSSLSKKKFEKREYGTEGSQVITDLSTNRACGCLTSQIGRDMVFSAKYGRTRSFYRVKMVNILTLPGYDAVGGGSIGFQNPDHKSINLRYKRYSLCTLLVLETFRINFWNNSSEKSSDFFYLILINYI